MRSQGVSATITFDDNGAIEKICCMCLNEKYGKIPVAPFYVIKTASLDLNAIRSNWLSWLEENFHDVKPFWYVYTFKEASVITLLLGNEWDRWWDGDRTVVVEQVISFLNNYSVLNKEVKFVGFWQAVQAFKLQHNFTVKSAAQQTYLLPDFIRILAHRVRIE